MSTRSASPPAPVGENLAMDQREREVAPDQQVNVASHPTERRKLKRRKINKTYMAKCYNKAEISAGINSMIAKGVILRNVSAGPMKNLSLEGLLCYVEPRMLPNLHDEIEEIRTKILGSSVGLSPEQLRLIELLEPFPQDVIKKSIRQIKPKFPYPIAFSMSKKDLVQSAVFHGYGEQLLGMLMKITKPHDSLSQTHGTIE